MPGRIIMDQPGASQSLDMKKDKSHAQEGGYGGQNAGAKPQNSQDTPMSDVGHHNATPNGGATTNGHIPTTNGEHTLSEVANMHRPPQLDQLWRSTDANKSMGKLMDRVAQRCYLDLHATLSEMNNMSAPTGATNQPNGILPGTVQLDESEVSRAKKRKLLEFANDQRDRFTKTLVLADWSKNADDMAKVIDINVWQRKQDSGSRSAAFEIADVRHSLQHFKMPAPNIEGAMELLATGKSAWVPDLGYIAPERLSAKQLLRTLQDMNVALATRLNLDEELPRHMNDFSIANGRASFRVPGEFEVDLTIADEDPSTPFYFIDIRFLFTPSSDLLPEIVRPRLEASVNAELASKGLQGCYDFLHNFVLTHKINVLRAQAGDMIRNGKWFDCIRVELSRRTLAVSYWTGVPGPKSWIVVGVTSGRQPNSSQRSLSPKLRVQWFCEGVAQDEAETLDFDLVNLELERCIMSVIAKHSLRKLQRAKAGIGALAQRPGVVSALIPNAQNSDCRDAGLKLSLPGMQDTLKIQIEPVTGQYSVSPVNTVTLHGQSRLNSIQDVQVLQELVSMAARTMQVRVNDQANLCGWLRLKPSLDKNVKLPVGTCHRSHFTLRGWSPRWLLTATFGIAGRQWFISRAEQRPAPNATAPIVPVIVSLWELDSREGSAQSLAETSKATLGRIERFAAAAIFHRMLASELEADHIPYHVPEPKAHAGDSSPALGPSATVFTKFSRVMGLAVSPGSKPWASEVIRLSFFGVDHRRKTEEGTAFARFTLKLTLNQGKLPELRKLLGKSGDQDIRVNNTGGLALRFWTTFGASLVEQIRIRLKNLERLDRYLATVKQSGLSYNQASLNSISIKYGQDEGLTAALTFADDGSLPVELNLLPDNNPHRQIRALLERSLNSKAPLAFASFVTSLRLTLPLLQTIARLEESHAGPQSFRVNWHAPTVLVITYGTPLPACKFELVARSKIQQGKVVVRWLLQEGKNPQLAEGLVKALKEYWKTADARWKALGNSIVASADAIAPALEKLDEVVRKSEGTKATEQQQNTAASAAPPAQSSANAQQPKPANAARPAQSGQQNTKAQNNNEVIELD